MRLIGKLESEKLARRFGDWLLVRGVENQVDAGSAGVWEIWIVEDAGLKEAQEAFARFCADPKAAEFDAGRDAAKIRNATLREARESKGRVVDVRTQNYMDEYAFKMPVTAGLIMMSVAIAFVSNLGQKSASLQPLFIVQHWRPDTDFESIALQMDALTHPLRTALGRGEVWRLITPIFIHFGIMHIFFNMSWMIDLGRMIEPKRGSLYMAFLVVLIAIPSNLLQYWQVGPGFGGMSGVVFGLIGYMWIFNKCSYRESYPLDPQTVTLSLVWLAVCWMGWVGPIANWAHGGGLAVGMLWGFLTSDRFARLIGK